MVRRLTAVIAALLVVLGACDSTKTSGTRPAAPTASLPPSSTVPPAPPDFPVLLDDAGLHLPPGRTPAGVYRVSFADHRTRRGEHVDIRFRPSGPRIELGRVSAGTSDNVTLRQNLIAYLTIDDVTRDVPIENQLDVTPSPKYSSPVT
jgi:hypothetical protein